MLWTNKLIFSLIKFGINTKRVSVIEWYNRKMKDWNIIKRQKFILLLSAASILLVLIATILSIVFYNKLYDQIADWAVKNSLDFTRPSSVSIISMLSFGVVALFVVFSILCWIFTINASSKQDAKVGFFLAVAIVATVIVFFSAISMLTFSPIMKSALKRNEVFTDAQRTEILNLSSMNNLKYLGFITFPIYLAYTILSWIS